MNQRKDSHEIGICHAYLNALHSHAQGRYTALNVLTQALGADAFSAALVQSAAHIEKYSELFRLLWNAQTIELDPKSPHETAQSIRKDIALAVAELTSAASEVEKWLRASPQDCKRDQVAKLLSWLAYQAYSHEHYVKNLIHYGEVFALPEVSERWRQQLISCGQEVQNVHVLLSHLLGGETPLADVYLGVVGEAAILPGILRAKAQDFVQLEAIRSGVWSFELVGIGQEQAKAWEYAGLDPAGSGYWLAYDFEPNEAALWLKLGFTDPAGAASWKVRAFEPAEALEWALAGIPPHQAASFRLSGVTDPSQLNVVH